MEQGNEEGLISLDECVFNWNPDFIKLFIARFGERHIKKKIKELLKEGLEDKIEYSMKTLPLYNGEKHEWTEILSLLKVNSNYQILITIRVFKNGFITICFTTKERTNYWRTLTLRFEGKDGKLICLDKNCKVVKDIEQYYDVFLHNVAQHLINKCK